MTATDQTSPTPDEVNARAEQALRSRRYVVLLVAAAILGIPISVGAYWFLKLINSLQGWTYTNLPHGLGFSSEPEWWPVVPLAIAGLAVGLTIRFLPGTGGRTPIDGFHAEGPPRAALLPGILIAALASISL